MKRFLFLITLLTAGVATAQEHFAQTMRVDRYDYIYRRNPWNTSENAAGIRQDNQSQSYAEAYFMKENGKMCDFSASDDSWTAGARTESIRHFDKISFAGRFQYDYFDGKNMCGSMFIHPGFYPVDILEFTPGRKIKETYSFTGGLSADLNAHWRAGLKVDLTAQNYAKRKDLRHKNKRLDFEFAPSVMFQKGDWSVGANYLYAKNSERVTADEIGTSPESYKAFFDKGLGYGVLERWDGNGTHLNETGSGITGFPVKEQAHGFSTQVQWRDLFAELSYRSRRGETGEKEVFWHYFDTDELGGRLNYTLHTNQYAHYFRANIHWEKQDNRENSFKKESINGVPTVIYFGSMPIFSRRTLNIGAEYEIHSSVWNLRAGIEAEKIGRQSTLYYPQRREQAIHYVKVYAEGMYNVKQWEFTLGMDFRKGGYSEEAFTQDTDLETDEYPYQLTDYYNFANEYYTASRMSLKAGVRYNIKQFYIDLTARYEHAFDVDYLRGEHHVKAILSLGYNF